MISGSEGEKPDRSEFTPEREESCTVRVAQAPRLTALATAVPPHVLHQAEVRRRVLALFDGIERMLPVYENAGIDTRYSCVPIEWYLTPSTWRERNALYIDNAVRLLARCTDACLQQAGIGSEAIDAIVVVSSSGIATPSLDARLMQRMAFRADVQRLPIFGLGCAGGVLGLSRACALARSAPGSRVLFLVVELCGLTFRAEDTSKSNIVATALFGDGAAGAIVTTAADRGPRLLEAGEHTWRSSLDVMGWRIEDAGLGVLFSRDIPTLVRDQFGAPLAAFLKRCGLSSADISGYISHPGGTKVIAALETVFGLQSGGLETARSVLREYGNMSAATVLFVLERTLRGTAPGLHLMSALGPGFSVGFQLLDVE